METDCFPNEPFHFLLRVADDADPWEVRTVGPPAVAFVLDHD